jgi:hypothetical protein
MKDHGGFYAYQGDATGVAGCRSKIRSTTAVELFWHLTLFAATKAPFQIDNFLGGSRGPKIRFPVSGNRRGIAIKGQVARADGEAGGISNGTSGEQRDAST